MEIIEIKTKDCIPTPDNPRLRIDETSEKFAELLASVQASGVREPVKVRRHPKKKNKYDLRDGARRLRASEIAGHATLPAIVQEMTDAEAMELTVCSFLGREDLTALEAGEATAKLLDAYGGDHQAVASRLGISAREVARRARISSLTEEWINSIREGEGRLDEWTPAHLELIARYEHEEQNVLLEEYRSNRWNVPSVAELGSTLQRRERSLAKAKWYMDEPLAGAGPCANCMKRTDVKADLFGEAAAGDDDARCTDADCWEAKEKAWLKAREKELKKQYKVHIGKASISPNWTRGKVLTKTQYKPAKHNTKGAVPVMMVDGPDQGAVKYVKPTGGGVEKIRTSKPKKKPKKSTGKAPAQATREERIAEMEIALQNARHDRILELIGDRINPEIPDNYDRYNQVPSYTVHAVFGSWDGVSEKSGGCTPTHIVDALGKAEGIKKKQEMVEVLWRGVLRSVTEWIEISHSDIDERPDAIRTVLAEIKIDYDAIVRQAEAELPEPPELVALRDPMNGSLPVNAQAMIPGADGKRHAAEGHYNGSDFITGTIEDGHVLPEGRTIHAEKKYTMLKLKKGAA